MTQSAAASAPTEPTLAADLSTRADVEGGGPAMWTPASSEHSFPAPHSQTGAFWAPWTTRVPGSGAHLGGTPAPPPALSAPLSSAPSTRPSPGQVLPDRRFGLITPPVQARLAAAASSGIASPRSNAQAAVSIPGQVTPVLARRRARTPATSPPDSAASTLTAALSTLRKRARPSHDNLAVSPALDAQAVSARVTGPSAADLKEVVLLAVRDAVKGFKAEVSNLTKTCDTLCASIERLADRVNTHGVGIERTARAVHQLTAAMRDSNGGRRSPVPSSRPPQPDTPPTPADSSAPATGEERRVVAAKRREASANDKVVDNIRKLVKAGLLRAMFVEDGCPFPTAAVTRRTIADAVQEVLRVDMPTAQLYVNERRLFPVRKADGIPQLRRPSVKLNRIRPHLLCSLQRHVFPVFLRHAAIAPSSLTAESARAWLNGDKYTHSRVGTPSITAAITSVHRRVGAHAKVVQPEAAWDRPFVECSTQMYALVSSFIRCRLEEAAGVDRRDASTNKKQEAYVRFREEVALVCTFLPRDSEVHDGLRLTDGHESDRGVVVSDEGDSDMSSDGDDADDLDAL